MIDNSILIPVFPPEQKRRRKDKVNRITNFMKWLDITGKGWYEPDLTAYKNHLYQSGSLQPSTINSIIATIRTRYRELLNDTEALFQLSRIFGSNQTAIDECIQKMRRASDPRETPISFSVTTRLYPIVYPNQMSQLLNTPDTRTFRGSRDVALLSTLLFMGLRESEARLITVNDVYFTGGAGETGIHVPKGSASTERFVPFYEDFPVQAILEAWLDRTGIQSGPLFRGFYRNEKGMRDTAITIQAIEDIFRLYPLYEGEQQVYLKPSDLRVYYARMLYALDFSLDVIADNLGVKTGTVVNYIGTPLDTKEPIPMFDMSKLRLAKVKHFI